MPTPERSDVKANPHPSHRVAIIGSGNIGTDLLMKIRHLSTTLDVAAVAGVDPDSKGLAIARRLGVATTAEGVDGLTRLAEFDDVELLFDATSASAHAQNAALAVELGKRMIDLTPAAVGPFVVPPVNLDEHIDAPNVNMVTCGGQATVPIVAAVSRIAPVVYAEIVASIASKSAGPGTRANIDEFTETTATAVRTVGGAQLGKAVIILNPADPPIIMRDTVFCIIESGQDEAPTEAIVASVQNMVDEVNRYVPGYRLKQQVQFDRLQEAYVPALRRHISGTMVSVFLEVSGAGHFLPPYAGNLDIMTSAALRTAERMLSHVAHGAAI
jgi:acetaldehyde dehydrogenase